MIEYVWNNRNHVCEVCNKKIHTPNPYVFAHILSKKMYPKYRYDYNNIMLVCSINCHGMVDKLSSWIKYLIEDHIKRWEHPTVGNLIFYQNM